MEFKTAGVLQTFGHTTLLAPATTAWGLPDGTGSSDVEGVWSHHPADEIVQAQSLA